ncbi:MAG TPA: hypothetical protein VFI17_03150 [Solirubrobacterales bacterium]|nr:hypothetical protein [Solirubrobacterales bacterium]
MATAPRHRITDLRATPGELSFEAHIAGSEPRRVWFRTDSDLVPNADAALATCVMPAMRAGGVLELPFPVSSRMLRTQREFQAIQKAWSLEWEFGDPPLREVEVEAPAREPGAVEPKGRVAAFFSGGVDSFATILENPDLTDLIFVRGIDILPTLPHQEGLADRVEARLREAAAELGMELQTVETNLRELTDPLARWEIYYGCAIAAVALFLQPLFDRVLIAADTDYEVQGKIGSSWLVDQLWSTEQLEIVDDSGGLSRMQKVARIAEHPVVQRTLRVCWRNPDGAYNCGRCRKCLLTMAALETVDALPSVETFPDRIDIDDFGSEGITQFVQLTLWEDLLDVLRGGDKPELERTVARLTSEGKAALGLPQTYRRRPSPGPAAPATGAGEPRLFATRETARALTAAEDLALLVGSYDGSGNLGDICQLDAALALLDRLGPRLLPVPVLERQYRRSHEEVVAGMLSPPAHAVFFGPAAAGSDDLVPIPAPLGPGLGLVYLYGGGFLNPAWGERKLEMLQAAESALAGAGTQARIGSGQQVDAEWIGSLGGERLEALSSFELIAARDEASLEALAPLAAPRTFNGGDDAVGVLPDASPAATASRPIVNVHVAEHDWVTDDPTAATTFLAAFLAELGGAAGGQAPPVRPFLAYLDHRVDERPAVARLRDACAATGLEVAEPELLRPASLAALAPGLAEAALTVSCSYHVALASLLLGVPTALLGDNSYYRQKAAGLLADFGLPPAFSLSSGDDPATAAATIADHLAGEDGAALRERIAIHAGAVRGRRRETEAELLAALARVALTAGTSSGGSRLEAAERRGVEAEARAEAAEQQGAAAHAALTEVLGSRSWKLTAPLRRRQPR